MSKWFWRYTSMKTATTRDQLFIYHPLFTDNLLWLPVLKSLQDSSICVTMTSQHNTVKTTKCSQLSHCYALSWQADTHFKLALAFQIQTSRTTSWTQNKRLQNQFSLAGLTCEIFLVFSGLTHFSWMLEYGFRDRVRRYLTSFNWEHP